MTLPLQPLAVVFALVVLATACSSDESASSVSTTVAAPTTSTTAVSTTAASTTAVSTTAVPSTDEPTDDGCAVGETGATSFTLDAGGASHPVRVFVPSSFDGTPLPVVLNWHGLGSDGPQQAQFSDYETLAESEGFLAVHPTGVPGPGDDRNSWELAQFDDPERNDIEFANVLIDQLITDFCAEPTRVYSTGMSNGGFFTSRLVCELSGRIAAAVSVAGLSHHDECAPERTVPFMAFHGTADDVVPFGGGASTLLEENASSESLDFFSQVMPDEFAQFAASNGCDSDPVVEAVSAEVVRYDYPNCVNDVEQIFFEITDGGHTWPGSPLGPFLVDVLGYTTPDVSATVDGWEFMREYTLP